MDRPVDLNALRELMRRHPERSDDDGVRVMVDSSGEARIKIERPGEAIKPGQSTVPKTVFAAMSAQYKEDLRTVMQYFPKDTKPLTCDGINGFIYKVRDEFAGQEYTFFLYRDANGYCEVVCVNPLVRNDLVHEAHVFKGGRLCLSSERDGGLRDIQETFAQSVVWATGYSIWLKTNQWPWRMK